MKYLEVKNWGKFQTAKKNCQWIKDYTEKDFDPDFSELTLSQKGMLDAVCRLRARYGRPLPNNPLWICSAVAVKAQERHNAVAAIKLLIDRGFLVPSNQQLNSLEERREDENRTEKEEIAKELPPIALAQKVVAETSLPKNPNIMQAVAGAIEFLVKVDHKSPNAAVEFLTAHVLDETAKGSPPNRFWFDDRKWMVAFAPMRESQAKQVLKRVFNEAE